MITASINVDKIDKTKLFKGEKGTYLNVVLIDRKEPDQNGNDMFVAMSTTKEEREKGIRGTILGSAKTFSTSGVPKPHQRRAPNSVVEPPTPTQSFDDADDVPF